MKVLHERLLYLENKVKEQQRLNKRYHKVLNERFDLIQKKDRQEQRLISEIRDVEKLHGFSLENIVYTIFLSKEKKLQKRRTRSYGCQIKI